MEAKFGTLEKMTKILASKETTFFKRTNWYTLLDHERDEEIEEELKV